MGDEGTDRSGALPRSFSGPGLVDLQVNGYGGFDFNSSPDTWSVGRFETVASALNRRGVVVALPTFITDAVDRLLARARRYGDLLREEPLLEKTFPKLHVEGPFLTPEEGPRGVHPLAHVRTPAAIPGFLPRMIEASGNRIGILTLAPELPGALELIEAASKEGICVAIGHTAASPQRIREAVLAGARLSTHLGNGSHAVLPRLDNYVEAQLSEDRLHAGFIADGHHVPFYTLKNFMRAKTPIRSILVTDAIAAADMGPGEYMLAGAPVRVSEDLRTSRPGISHLVGSALTLDRAVINATLHCGVSFEQAWKMASTLPAALAGLDVPQPVKVEIRDAQFGTVTIEFNGH